MSEIYIDATDVDVEGTFVWSTDNTTMTYVYWEDNEPGNCCGAFCVCGAENCVVMRAHFAGRWNDVNCDHEYPSVCEIEGKWLMLLYFFDIIL